MKFAVLALLGVTQAVKEYWAPEDVAKAWKQAEAIGRTVEDAKHWFPEHQQEMDEFKMKVAMWGAEVGPKYMPKLEAWGKSASVMEAKEHKKKLMESAEVKRIAYDGYGIYDNFAHQVWDSYQGFTPEGGYVKYMDNADLGHMLEDLYQIKEDLKALVESKVARK